MRLYGTYQVEKRVPVKRRSTVENRGVFQAVNLHLYRVRGLVEVHGGLTVRLGLVLYQNPTAAMPVPRKPSHLVRAKLYRIGFGILQFDKTKSPRLVANHKVRKPPTHTVFNPCQNQVPRLQSRRGCPQLLVEPRFGLRFDLG